VCAHTLRTRFVPHRVLLTVTLHCCRCLLCNFRVAMVEVEAQQLAPNGNASITKALHTA
jgi:hypothetical protein